MARIAVCLLVIGFAGLAAADPLTVGAAVSPRTFEDQHGNEHRLDEAVRVVVFHRDMEAGDAVKEALSATTGKELSERGVAYLADISRMPKLIGRLFALPAMRRRPYPMWLDPDGTQTADLPSEPGRITLLRLDRLKVTAIDTLESAEQLRTALGLTPGGE
jgi:hypothetical protein